MSDPSPLTTPASLEEVWDQLAALRHDLLALVTAFKKVLNYLGATLEKRNAPEAEQRAALSRVFGGTGGGAPEQFGPPTPAPEPTGSAPGSEFEA